MAELKFPQVAAFCYNFINYCKTNIEGLSPKTRKNLGILYQKAYELVTFLASYLIAVYPNLLKFGEIGVGEWQEPSALVLRVLSFWVLFWFPMTVQDLGQSNSKKLMYVGNQQVYSFGTLNLLAYVYRKDKILPRTLIDQVHFKIPLWKQVLEYFGCVEDSRENLELLASLGQPILIYPGGFNEFSKFNPEYNLDFNPSTLTDILEIANRYQYSLLPFGNVGGTDMYTCLVTLPYNLNFDTLPVLIPSSYQRQYLTIQKETLYSSKIPVYLELVQDVARNVEISKHAQNNDQKRYLMLALHKLNVRFQSKFLQKDGIIVKSFGKLASMSKMALEGLIKFGKKRFHPGPIIEEIEE